MKKEIRFSSSIDTKEFDRAIENMQRKLQQVYQRSDVSRQQLETKANASRAGFGQPVTPQDRVRVDQEERRSRRELDKFIRDQVKENENLSRELNKQLSARKELVRLAEKDVEAKRKLSDLERQINTNREKMRAGDEAIRGALQERNIAGFGGYGGVGGAFERAMAAYRGAAAGGAGFGGRIGAAATGFGRGMGQFAAANPLNFIAGALGATGSAVGIGTDIFSRFSSSERERQTSRGVATSNAASPLVNALNRQAFSEAMFATERATALEKATEEVKREKVRDIIGLGGKLLGVGAAAAGGAAAGAAFFGIGAIPGAIGAGAAALYGTGAYDDIMGYATGTRQAGYESRRAELANENFQSLKNLNPLKQLAAERYQTESLANLPIQRMLGLGDDGIMSALASGAAAGFTTDQTRSSMAGIISSGGSTRAARGLGTTANLLERNLGLTNATQTIGRLSGLTGSADATNAALTKVLAEAFSLGLDDSEFREEQRKFVDSAVEVITRTGALTPEAQGALTKGLGEFVAGRDLASIQGAKTAFDVVSQTTATTGGARGAIQAAALNRDPAFASLNMDEKNALLGLSEQQILAGGPLVEGILSKTGLSPEELIEKVKRPALSTRADVDKKIEMLKSATPGSAEEKQLKSSVLAGLGYDNQAILNLRPAEQDALLKSLTGQELTEEEKALRDSAGERLATAKAAGPATAGDKLIAGQAAGDAAVLSMIKTFGPDLEKAADGAKVLADSAVAAAKTISDAYKSENFDSAKVQGAIDNLVRILNAAGTGQPQGRDLIQEKGAPSGN